MHTNIARWGNSNAVRLPADLMAQAGLTPGAPVRLTRTERGVLIEPAAPRYTLDQLLAQITPENLHGETDWGAPVGRELVE